MLKNRQSFEVSSRAARPALVTDTGGGQVLLKFLQVLPNKLRLWKIFQVHVNTSAEYARSAAMDLSIALAALAIILFSVFYRSRKKQMQIFKQLGIPGPEPNFLFGNLLAFKNKPMFRKYQDWRQEFGETYGYFEGPTPVLVSSDVHLIQDVFIKQFNNFHARKLWPVQVDPDSDEDVHMFFARGRRWKRLRNVVNPAFSASKIRQMAPTVNDSINQLLEVIKDSSKSAADRSIEVLNLFRRLTLDSILRCEVGVERSSVKDPDDPFLRHCKGVINDTTKMPWLYLLGFLFPTLHSVWITVYKCLHYIKFNPVFWLEDRMREVVVMRRQAKKENKRCDLMQQMLDAQFKADSFKDIEKEHTRGDSSHGNTLRSMTNEEIVSHALLFLLAGYETTSTTLTYIFFELSQNPHVQQQLRREIMTVLPRGHCEIAFDDLKKLTYLDYVIWEALRKYPLASSVTARQCVQSCTIQGLTIPEGLLIHANLWDVQYDPKHWGDNPHEFDPLRFLPEMRKTRHPAAWMPFGAGPRSCAGLRFALLQLKMVVAKVLRDFDFHLSERLSLPLNLEEGATIMPADGVHLSALRRPSAMTEIGSLRRMSSVLAIAEMAGVNVGSRRASLATTEDDVDRDSAASDEEMDMEASWRSYLAKRRSSRRSSILDDELTQESICDIRRASITKGIEMLQVSSIHKGLNLMRRASCGTVLEKCGDIGQSNPDRAPTATQSSSLLDNNFIKSNLELLPSPPELSTEPTSFLRSKQSKRRASALPELESVRELKTLTEFSPRPELLDDVQHGFNQLMDKNILPLTFLCDVSPGSRLYKRRVSG
ncbi:cytochrome p450 3a29-like [Plakobranchus ocellatus]|uniref:Cytochrome p450 3a29-like n=1 Tax=Plakobranchus ocellatus TaxID=259542 RepID=A0AAV3YLZ5_9GAST|nr:cytochrome p450 3a29-like [Plakobranchus ocellatus]